MKYTNQLIHESSPYLLQHAHNPVNWFAWNNETLELAKKVNKLILISIGYSACHWCHVMEKECFEDEQVAKIMNDNFINIKVDREERPDIDQVYMSAVQLMTGQGGWPLNCFALPDGKPVYGGTYFPKQKWMNVLLNLFDTYKQEPQKVLNYANRLTNGIRENELLKDSSIDTEIKKKHIAYSVNNWIERFDNTEGGPMKAPKFALPNNYLFLLRYAHFFNQITIEKHVELTLTKIAFGGIYDHLGGGFSRYSTDIYWKVPHFEKMLYDNAQLVSLYSEAFLKIQNPLYKKVVYETLEFVETELTSPEGTFYSALDADSEGVEGKYYVWTKEELKELLGNSFALFADYYSVNETGYWEHNNYILLRKEEESKIAEKHNLSITELNKTIDECKKILLEVRSKRIKPALDDKQLTSWNALMIKAYVDAYFAFSDHYFLTKAITCAQFIEKNLISSKGNLLHNYKNKKATINGFLEDYAFVIESYISIYEATFDEHWLVLAKQLMEYSIIHFYDKEKELFYFTSDKADALITRYIETSDNVIPASNSSIANSLFVLGKYFVNDNYLQISLKQLSKVKSKMIDYGSAYSNWGLLALNNCCAFFPVITIS